MSTISRLLKPANVSPRLAVVAVMREGALSDEALDHVAAAGGPGSGGYGGGGGAGGGGRATTCGNPVGDRAAR